MAVSRIAMAADGPEFSRIAQGFVAPAAPMAIELCRIWSSVLGLEKVGVHDNFFTIGGDSIITIQVVSRARKAGIHISPRDLFEHPTVAELARKASPAKTPVDAPQEPVTGRQELVPIARWFFESQDQDLHHFNQAVIVPVPGSLNQTQQPKLIRSLYDQGV